MLSFCILVLVMHFCVDGVLGFLDVRCWDFSGCKVFGVLGFWVLGF